MMRFHRRCGDRVTLLNDNSTAIRNFVEFNHGLILSAEPLRDDHLFEVSIDRKVNVWNGSLEIGVTTLDPEFMELPATATKLRNTAWIMSGSSIVKDGATLVNSYGPELDTLREGDCLGVKKTSKGDLLFYVNGRCLGVAAKDLPSRVFAVIDLYGQCVQVSIIRNSSNVMRTIMESSVDQIDEDPNNDDTLTSSDIEVAGLPPDPYPKETRAVFIPITSETACALVAQDHLRFHPRCGILVKLSNNNKSAERARPLDDYNNGVVMTHRPLYDNELFEIRIDRLVDKWSGSIEVGVTSHNPATIRFPSTMTNMDSGTIMMSGCKVLLNGHGTCIEYGNFNLDELREGDTVGMIRKSNGNLHYFINGVDQGIATDKVDHPIWGVIDLYGMTVKVSIVDPCEDIENNFSTVPSNHVAASSIVPEISALSRYRARIEEDSLLFHTLRDSNVIIINYGKTAHRPNAFEHFNNGIVMTNRTLRTNELFQVRLDLVIPKWAGSIEIGVTQHSSNDIKFPFKMSNAKSGTWAMTGEDVIRDGTIIIPQYVRNLNRLMEGDTVGVMRKDLGILHFYVNGVDQGPAAFNIPEHVFGIIDLYGRVAQATIVDVYSPPLQYSPDSPLSTESNATMHSCSNVVTREMCFHRVHGRNARLSRDRLTASRSAVYSEFNDSVLFSSRPLRECDMFELRIDKMVDCWIGSLEIGVTAIRPEDLELSGGVGAVAGTATDLTWDTYILSGSAMMKDGECVRSGYPLDLDLLTTGSRVGMMWHADRSLHYYLDGMDMGKAWYVPHLNIYAVIDLYGQCTQVTIMQNEERVFNYNGCLNSENSTMSIPRSPPSPPPPYWSFSEYCGENICLMYDYSFARRLVCSDHMRTLNFSSAHLACGEIFEIKIIECKHGFAGSFRMGVTDVNILNANVNRNFPPTIAGLPHYTAYIDGSYVKYALPGSRSYEMRSFLPSFEWLRPGDRVGFIKTTDQRVLVYLNSELLDTAIENVPDKVYVVMELYGHVIKIQSVFRNAAIGANGLPTVPNDELSKSDSIIDECIESEVAPIEGVVPDNEEISNDVAVAATETDPLSDPPKKADAKAKTASESDTGPDDALEDGAEETNPPLDEYPKAVTETRLRRHALPYTFHYVHGENIKLCSSDTVAVRTSGFSGGIAIVSQPLRRGHHFRFRVDKIAPQWEGSASIGAVAVLPTESLPPFAVHLEPPVWILSSDLLYDNGVYMNTDMAAAMEEEVGEQTVLTIYFRFNSDLVIEMDGKVLGVIGSVPNNYRHVFPMIDLYGKVQQISVLLHPCTFTSGASLDLPMIAEIEETFVEMGPVEEADVHDHEELLRAEAEFQKRALASSEEDLAQEVVAQIEPVVVQAGPSTADVYPQRLDDDPPNQVVRRRTRRTLHESLIVPSKECEGADKMLLKLCMMQKSHSTQNFSQPRDSESVIDREVRDALRVTLSLELDAEYEDSEQFFFCDTNKRQNDRYPEVSESDSLDNDVIDPLTMDTTNLLDLVEEPTISFEASARRDEFWAESLSTDNLNYLAHLLKHNQEIVEGPTLESMWEASGVNCEHLHLVLKYWTWLTTPFPNMRQAVSWEQVKCFCMNCQPGELPPFAGWVRIERLDASAVRHRGYWHVARPALAAAQSTNTPPRRPHSMVHAPYHYPPVADIWLDEEYKPHHTVIALEIDIDGGSNFAKDRILAFYIYLKSHVAYRDEHMPRYEE